MMNVPEYWIARRSLSSGRPKAGRVAGDDSCGCGVLVSQ